MASKSNEDDNLTVSQIYETLKSGPFLKKLYWDALSDIKDKGSFKELRETTEKLLNKKSETLANLSDSKEDNYQRKKIVTEVCSMTYAIDTVFSKIMFLKLQKEFKSQIIDAIKDLRKEKKIPDSVYNKLQISHDTEIKDSMQGSAGKSNVPPAKKPGTPSRPVRTKRLKLTPSQIAAKNHELRSEIHNDLKAINSNESNIDAIKKNLRSKTQTPKRQVENKSIKSTPNKSKQNGEDSEKNNTRLKKAVTPKDNLHFENTEEIKVTPKGKMNEDSGSETDSIISVGHLSTKSTTSVSSVHTSDLSSFDDAISLYSEDEDVGTKRKVSLKELEEMCSKSELSAKCNAMLKNLEDMSKERPKKTLVISKKQQIEENPKRNPMASNKQQTEENSKKKAVVNNKQQIESPPDELQDSAGSSSDSKSGTPKSLPKRIRKPNSKYASESILCPITKMNERKKSSSSSSLSENGKHANDALHIKRRNHSLDSDEEIPPKSIKTDPVEENVTKINLNTPKQPSSAENFKPQLPVRPLTSRRTAPVTLFST